MKLNQLVELKAQLAADGYSKEISLPILKRYLANFVGIDKYRLKYTIETLVELGYFQWISVNVLEIIDLEE